MSEPFNESDFDLPRELQADLDALYGTTPSVPPARSQRILSAAHAQLARPRTRWRALRWAGAAAAAVVLVAMFSVQPAKRDAAQQAQLLRGDIDGNATVNILDAFSLARKIESDQTLDPNRADLTRDGKVNRADVDAIALLAVQLDPAGGAR